MPDQAVAALQLRLDDDAGTLQLTLRAGGAPEQSAVVEFASPLRAADAGETRWLLEDHPRLRGASADPIARRIEARLEDLAAELRQAVFGPEPARSIAERIADRDLGARLRVSVEEPAGAAWIPWELMLAPGGADPLSVVAASFSRASAVPPAARPAVAGERPRVLLVTCRPRGDEDVPFRSVASRIVQAVAATEEPDLEIDVLRPPTYAALQARLTAARRAGNPFDVVHFDGHGVYRADVLDPDRRRGYLLFEGPDGQAEEVPGTMLGEDLAGAGVRWLLLNSCRSAYAEPTLAAEVGPAAERAFGSLAGEVRAAGVGGVMAVGFNLYVVTAAKLVADCYSALAAGLDLTGAVTHARRRLYRGRGEPGAARFGWLVPLAFDAGLEKAGPGTGQGKREIRPLEIRVSTTTPASTAVVDAVAADGPRSDQRPFFGCDAVLLRLDRECGAGRPVEIVGLAGSGKSAVAGELARWWAATTDDAAVVIDVPAFDSYMSFEAELSARMELASAQAAGERCLVVMEGASDALQEATGGWNAGDRERLAEWILNRRQESEPLVLTGRAPCGLDRVITVTLAGLDAESRAELAAHAGFGRSEVQAAAGLLDWSQGVPAVVLELPRIVAGTPLHQPGVVRKILWALRSGKTEPPALGLALMERTRLQFVDVSRIRRVVLPFALALFQGHLSDWGWRFFSDLAASSKLLMATEGEPVALLREELEPAVRGGLVCRVDGGYALHPLAPIAIEPGFAGTLQALAHGDPEMVRRVMGVAWSSYIQTVSTTLRTCAELGFRGFGTLREQRENLWNAIEIALVGAWWGLALPLLHQVRDMLLADSREAEWETLLDEALGRLRESPPDPDDMGPENADLHVVRLLAAEAERHGDAAQLQQLRALQLALARAEDVTFERVEPTRE
jgi:CHAT domain